MKYVQAKRKVERTPQMVIESSQKQEGELSRRDDLPTEDARVKVVLKWSDIFGSNESPTSNGDSKPPGKEKPQQLVRKKDHPVAKRRHNPSRQMMQEWRSSAED